MATAYVFGPYRLDPSARQLWRDDRSVAVPSRQFDILLLLVAQAGQLLSKEALIAAAWHDVAVTDNSLEQAISGLRRTLGGDTPAAYIETAARRGYRFVAPVERVEHRRTDDELESLLAPHKAWIEGRAALETLEIGRIVQARERFEQLLSQMPGEAPAHVGLANACVLQFEMTRADAEPDAASLALAARHAREACRLDPRYGEAWATLGFVLDRAGQRGDALAASRKAVSLEPDNWRHRLRLAYVSWGEERLRESRRTLSLLPGFPLAHWLAATVHVAREALGEAERELDAGAAAAGAPHVRFSSVAVHWLLGLVRLANGDRPGAMQAFEQELARESSGHLYARECCANTWYAIGAVHLRSGETAAAGSAFREALARVPRHPFARLAVNALTGTPGAAGAVAQQPTSPASESGEAQASAAALALSGRVDAAVALLERALSNAPEGSTFWTLPVDPILRVTGDRRWSALLGRLRHRAA